MVNIYHLNINKKQIKNAKLAIIPGDPARVPKIALALDRNSVELAFNREYRTYLSKVGNAYILTTSTGIGGPSATIAIEELAYLGVEKFLRVGTTGSIQKGLKVGDIVITTAAVRLDGASAHYAPLEYPAVADFYITRVLVDTAEKLKLNFKVGITASSDTFYPGQERYDSFSGYVIRRFQGSMKEWQKLNVLNYEMESSAVFTICSALGLKAGCVAGVVVNRTDAERIDHFVVSRCEENTINLVKESVTKILAL